jgi:hypothetical protein
MSRSNLISVTRCLMAFSLFGSSVTMAENKYKSLFDLTNNVKQYEGKTVSVFGIVVYHQGHDRMAVLYPTRDHAQFGVFETGIFLTVDRLDSTTYGKLEAARSGQCVRVLGIVSSKKGTFDLCAMTIEADSIEFLETPLASKKSGGPESPPRTENK